MDKEMQQFDVIIVGGGMVGGVLACALAPSGLRIAVIERSEPAAYQSDQPMDLRVSAISVASQQLLESVGAWQHVEAMRKCPYRFLETWEGENSNVVFDSQAMGREHLGHIIENRVIQLSVWQQLANTSNVELLIGQDIKQLEALTDGYRVHTQTGLLECKLLIGADGANSMVRDAANIGVTAWDYAQHAMLINITTEQSQQDITWQQFTPNGPRALLPLSGNKASLVWYDKPEVIKKLANMPTDALKQQIIENFPSRLGGFTVDNCGAFPLTRRHAQQYVKSNVCIVGDAAHTINPLAGQGVNLGFKDVAALSELINQAANSGQCWWANELLAQYEKARRGDNLLMQGAMDLFYVTFSNQHLPIKLLRNTALRVAGKSSWGKNKVMKYAMGL